MTHDVSVILLSGGTGTRMGHATPKQYLPLNEKPIALYSFEAFFSYPAICEIVVVCEPEWQKLFVPLNDKVAVTFTTPGKRRQDSVYNGLKKSRNREGLICVHDSARPFMPNLDTLLQAALLHGAAVLGTPIAFTVKETDHASIVTKTLNRNQLWEIQTPQVARYDLLASGFAKAYAENITVTDDVSLVELLGKTVKVVPSLPTNIKITTPFDLSLAKLLMDTKL